MEVFAQESGEDFYPASKGEAKINDHHKIIGE